MRAVSYGSGFGSDDFIRSNTVVVGRTRHTAPGRTLEASSARLKSSKWARWMGLRHWNATASVSGGRLPRTSAAVWQGNTLRRGPRGQLRGRSGVGIDAVYISARAAEADLTGGIRQELPLRCGYGAASRRGAAPPLTPPKPCRQTARQQAIPAGRWQSHAVRATLETKGAWTQTASGAVAQGGSAERRRRTTAARRCRAGGRPGTPGRAPGRSCGCRGVPGWPSRTQPPPPPPAL